MADISRNNIETVKKIVKEVDSKIKRVYWTNKEIDGKFVKRSVNKILKDGNTFYRNPCGDVTLVTSYLMFQNKILHNWVIEEHLPTKDFDFNRLHFVLEFENNKKTNVLNYKELNKVYLYEGIYNRREDLPSSQIIKFSSDKIDFEKSLQENLIDMDITKKLNGYSLEKNLNRLKQDNFIEYYNNFKEENGNKFKIYELF